jgi:hypothetical protein
VSFFTFPTFRSTFHAIIFSAVRAAPIQKARILAAREVGKSKAAGPGCREEDDRDNEG